jgi:hypothetical protein
LNISLLQAEQAGAQEPEVVAALEDFAPELDLQ